jgi:hypothetical protein
MVLCFGRHALQSQVKTSDLSVRREILFDLLNRPGKKPVCELAASVHNFPAWQRRDGGRLEGKSLQVIVRRELDCSKAKAVSSRAARTCHPLGHHTISRTMSNATEGHERNASLPAVVRSRVGIFARIRSGRSISR